MPALDQFVKHLSCTYYVPGCVLGTGKKRGTRHDLLNLQPDGEGRPRCRQSPYIKVCVNIHQSYVCAASGKEGEAIISA